MKFLCLLYFDLRWLRCFSFGHIHFQNSVVIGSFDFIDFCICWESNAAVEFTVASFALVVLFCADTFRCPTLPFQNKRVPHY